MRRDLIALPDNSKVWIYQAPAPVSYEVSEEIKKELYDFTMQWKSHGHELDCYANLFHYQFLVFVADPSNLPSGCSIDSSVHFISELGKKYQVDFMDRETFAYMYEDKVNYIAKDDFSHGFSSGQLSEEIMMFDNLVNNKADFLEKWVVPLEESWHRRFK